MAEKAGGSRGRGGRQSGPSRSRKAADDVGEHIVGSGWQTALIDGETFAAKAVQYTVVDGLALFEGDIVLGTAEEVERRTQIQRDVQAGRLESAVMVTGANRRWPNCQVPFDIDSGLPNQNRVTDAIAHWESNTRFRFIQRTPQNASQFPDWVTFRPAGGCSSSVGKQGGQQFVNLGSGCSTGNVIHEIGHTIGLWHEQSREDRDTFVTIHWDKIQAGMEHNFDQHIADGDDVGAYDYGSIMHYPRDAFSSDGSDTITPVDPNAQIGQRAGLSPGDIAAANSICPAGPGTFKEIPKDRIKEIAKDPIRDPTRKEAVKDPIRDPTRKEVVKDPILDTIKERVLDTRKEVTADPKQLFDPGPGTLAEQTGPIRPPIEVRPGQFGGAVPFAVATGHQAPGLAGGGAGDAAGDAAAIDAELAQVADAIAQLDEQHAVLQQHYDALAAALAAAAEAEQGLGQ